MRLQLQATGTAHARLPSGDYGPSRCHLSAPSIASQAALAAVGVGRWPNSSSTARVSVRTFSISKRGGCEMSPLFKLQNYCSTRAVQLLVQVFHLVFHLHLWCFTLLHTIHTPSGRRRRSKVGTASPRPSAAPACVILCDVLLAAHSV
jgi:hypothetical protein